VVWNDLWSDSTVDDLFFPKRITVYEASQVSRKRGTWPVIASGGW
jgi:hypothetical protein